MKKIISVLTAAAILSAGLTALTAAPAAAETSGTNLLVNGNFEKNVVWNDSYPNYTSFDNWYCYKEDNNFAWTTSEQNHTDPGSLSGKVYNGKIGQLVSLEAGDYTLTAYMLTWGSNGVLGLYDTDITPIQEQKLPDANGKWKEVSLDITCATDASYVVQFSSTDETTVFVDDIVLTKNEAVNPITNADFSSGTDEWTLSGDAATVSNEIMTIKGKGNNTYTQTVSQTVTGLTAGTYDLTLDVTNDDIAGTYYAYAKTAGHTTAMTALPETSTAMKVTVPGIETDNGNIEIGVYASGSSTITLDNFNLSASASTRLPFLKGGEISKLTYVEDNGGKFYRADGTEGDALQIMAENGFNLARIRVLNDPGKGHGDGTYYLPAGYQTIDDCIALAKRAKAKGMQIEFTFAYSDYWVDGDKQMIPHEWQEYIDTNNLIGTDKYSYLENQVYNYTKAVMEQLKEQGTTPEYVSIGNEMQSGLFFGNAKANDYKHEDLYCTDWDWLVRFVNAGARAVKEVSPSTKVIVHSDKGGEAIKWSDTSFYNLLEKGTNIDVMAVSYYPYYNANISIDDVVSEFNTCISTFNKDVMIMESGYNFAEKRSDGYEGQLEHNGYYQSTYGESIAGQRAYLTELYNKMKQVSGGRCIGVSYWDPVMITDNVGWAISENGDYMQGNVISNSTIFDFNGKAVEGQLAMKYNTNASDRILITGKLTQGNASYSGDATISINGTSYAVTSDKFGEYIAAVPYPESGSFTITADNSNDSYTKDAPTDGILVSGVDFTIAAAAKPEAKLEAADWGGTEGTGYEAEQNKLTRGNDTLYGYMATLKGNRYTYNTVRAYVETVGENATNKTHTFKGMTFSGTGEMTFYILTNAELNTESSRIYCE